MTTSAASQEAPVYSVYSPVQSRAHPPQVTIEMFSGDTGAVSTPLPDKLREILNIA